MPSIRIKVTAAADASLASVFVPLINAGRQARKKVAEDLAAGAMEGSGPYRSMPARAKPGFDGLVGGAKAARQAMGDLADGARAKFEGLAQGLKQLKPSLDVVTQEANRALASMERAQARAMLGVGPQGKAPTSFLGRLNNLPSNPYFRHAAFGVASRVAGGALNFGARVGGDLVRGIGVNTDLATMFHQQVSLESMATDLSNSGYMPGDERNGRRVRSDDLVAEARKVATQTASDPNQVLGGLQEFVGKTGDLATGRDALKDLAVLSKATGTNLTDMVSAAGDVANQLGPMADKGKAVYEVMKMVAGQGKLGAVEIRDMASQMAKIAAGASQFSGDVGHNIQILGALAQEARQRGGSASATQAATSVASFVNTFSKGKRLDAFAGYGVEVHGVGGLRDPREIIVDALNAAMRGATLKSSGLHGKAHVSPGGESQFSHNLGEMFADVRARSAVQGFASVYEKSYASQKTGTEQEKMAAATAAVSAEFDRLQNAMMSDAEIQVSFAKAMSTTGSRVTVFNDQIAASAAEMQSALLPALEALSPLFVQAATDLSTFLEKLLHKEGTAAFHETAGAVNVLSGANKLVEDAQAGSGEMYRDPASGEWKRKAGGSLTERQVGQVKEAKDLYHRQLDEAVKRREELTDLGERSFPFVRKGTFSDQKELKEMANGPFAEIPDTAQNIAAQILKAQNDVGQAKQNAEMADQIADRLNAALRSGALEVKVTEMPPPKSAGPGSDVGNGGGEQAPHESQ